MSGVRYKVKECNLHFGYDDVMKFHEYFMDNTMIVGKEYFVNTMVTNLISELILEYTPKDIILSVWDASKLYFDKRTSKDMAGIDCVKFAGDDQSDYLATFILDIERWVQDREKMYINEQCATVFEYERMFYESVPYHIVVINNWEERLDFRNDICVEAFYASLGRLLDKAAMNKTYVILASSGNYKLPSGLQHKFQYVVHGGGCQDVLAWEDTRISANLFGEKTVAVKFRSSYYDILTMPDFYSSVKDILNRKKYPCGIIWEQNRIDELKKLYDMGGMPK